MKKLYLSIPQPCHEDWNKMSPEDKGRLCASCQKVVVDFTSMSDRQLAEFFKKPQGHACGRFQQEQLERDIVIPGKRVPWIKYFFQFALPAFLVSMKATAQKAKIVVPNETISNRVMLEKVAVPVENKKAELVKGRLVDKNGNGIVYATIMVKGTHIGTQTDSTGNFQIKIEPDDNLVLVASAVGYETVEVKMKDFIDRITMEDKMITLNPVIITSNELTGRLGGFVVCTRVERTLPTIKQIIDTAFSRFSIYPNPVQKNSSFKIDVKKVQTGNYLISIINLSGQTVQSTEAVIENKYQIININLKDLSAGNYFVRLINRNTGKYFTEKIVVQ